MKHKISIEKGKRILVVEDSERRIRWFQEHLGGPTDYARTLNQGLHRAADASKYDVVFLDHDAIPEMWSPESNNIPTFYQVAVLLANQNYDGQVVIHSYNPVGAKRMANIIRSEKTLIWPFGTFEVTRS